MDPVFLSRLQFALTVGFHFLFPPLSIGLGWLIVGLMTRYVKSGSELDERIARPTNDLLGQLLLAEVDGEKLSRERQ